MTTRRIVKRVSSELVAGNPAWKIIVLKNNWLCPYCGEIGAPGLRMEDSLEQRMAQHLAACPAYGDGEGAPLDRTALEKKAALITLKSTVRRSLRDEPFHVTDGDGGWVCAYCARPTTIQLETVEGGTDFDDRTITLIVRHLLECDRWDEGRGKVRAVPELAAAAQRSDRRRRAKRLRQALDRDPAWRFRDMERNWICPFCAEPTEILFEREDETPLETCEAVLEHIEGCAAYSEFEGRPRTERHLKDRVIAINRERVLEKLRRKLLTHAVWQVTDADDYWYCPYCATTPGVKLLEPEKAGLPEGTLNEVWAHLSSCPAYAGKRARLKSKSYLRNVVGEIDRKIRLRREVRRAIGEDPRFTVHDAFGSWLCPHCRKVQKAISVPRDGALLDKTIEQVLTHLLEQCPQYAEGAEPGATLAALTAELDDQQRAQHRALTESEDWIRRIDQEVAALKTKVEVSAELERSLEDARSRQLRLLPRLPVVPGFEFGVVYKPCATVGGDFYDFIRVADDLLGIGVGDISGHGIEAALLVGLAKKLLEIHGRARTSPAETLLLANADIYPDLDAKTFVTAFYGLLNTRTRELRFSRAGHNPLVIFNPRRTPRLSILDSKGMALGMDPGPIFRQSLEEVSVKLERGDLIFQYTDGVPESMNHDKEEFGLERLYAVIEAHGAAEAEYLLYQIEKALADFSEGARQKDDITMVAVKVL